MDQMTMIEFLSETRKPRATLYRSEEKINELYGQCYDQIKELVQSEKIGGRVSAGLLQLFRGEVAAEEIIAGRVEIDPRLKAILIECQSKDSDELVDLSLDEPRAGAMLRYIGEGQIFSMNEAVTTERSGLPDDVVEVIQKERISQEQILRFKDDRIRTIVLIGKAKGQALASVASSEGIEFDLLASYGRHPKFGFLGRYEKQLKEVVFLAPFWIWHEGW